MGRRVVAVALIVLLPMVAACARRPAFQGQVLDPPRLTFLFTACPDVCPLIAGKIHEVTDLLGDRRGKVAFVVVTVDPERDTVRAVAEYSRQVAMLDRWQFLTGDQPQLAPIWTYYTQPAFPCDGGRAEPDPAAGAEFGPTPERRQRL